MFTSSIGTLLVLTIPSIGLSAESLQAAAVLGDITPPKGLPMWGYADRHDAPSVGTADPLQARVLVLASEERRIALVSVDLGRAPTRDSMARLRQAIRQAKIDDLFVVATHTHHGPVLELVDLPNREQSYVRQLETTLAKLIMEASDRLTPARLGVRMETVPWNHNRHSSRNDAPVDRELRVLRVEDTEGNVIAHAVNFAAHPTMTASGDRRYSADYCGALCREVERRTAAPCLFLQGAAGDLSVNRPMGVTTPDEFGKLIAARAITMSAKLECQPFNKPDLRSHTEEIHFKARIDITNVFVRQLLSQAFFPELVAFYEREYRSGVRSVLTTATLNGRIGFVGISGELFCAHSLRLKDRARFEHLFVMGYCNDYHQYFPTIESVAEGGYGTKPPIAMAELGAGERLMDRALIRLLQMSDRVSTLEAGSRIRTIP